MPNSIIRLLNRFKIWRMQRRGDALVDVKPFFDTMIDLADEIIQEPQSEIPRDLFIMLAYVFAAKEGQGRAHGHFEILRHIRERAWLGYKDAPALGALIVICGRPPLASTFLTFQTIWSTAVICPAC